ncbi:MAG: hypothetical protein K1X53_17260 [Candidatus Sumerlaeaceae bacterium]|nr:hypothetical protein [Candidatus Sumerlaeaceae bacterium]
MVFLCVGNALRADEATPSGGPKTVAVEEASDATAATVLDFDAVSQDLSVAYPLKLDNFSQVLQNSYNWQGPQDASLQCDIGFTPESVIIRGEFQDDHPFTQTMVHPAMADWWKITYGADGIDFTLDDPTSSAQQVRFVLNFGSRAVNPRIELLKTPLGTKAGFLETGFLQISDARPFLEKDSSGATSPIQFKAAIPLTSLADRRLFNGPLRITVRLHDVDGDKSSYLMMMQTVEKK